MTQSNRSIHGLKLPAALSLLSLLSVACDQDEFGAEPADAVEANDDAELHELPGSSEPLEFDSFEVDSSPDGEREGALELLSPPPPLLARVARGTASVEWRGAGDDGEILLIIGGTADDAPLLDMDTAESLTPIEAWVAIADEPTTVPERLLARATEAEIALLADPSQIDALRADLRHKLDHVRELQAQAMEPHAYGTCTSTQVATARSVFGQGYTSSSTCGDHLGFQNTNRTFYYCNSGSGCHYPLARAETSCIPAVNDNAFVTGSLAATTMRSKTNGNPNFATNSHRIRGFAYNCHGNASLNVHMAHGTSTWDQALASGYYVGVVVRGSGHLPERPVAIDYVSYGLWDNGISASGTTYQASSYSVTGNAAAGDFGIFCTDAQKSLTMSAGSTGNQYSWCIGSCSVGNCWDY